MAKVNAVIDASTLAAVYPVECSRLRESRPMDVLCAYNGRVYVLEFNQQSSFPGGGWGTPSRMHELPYTIPTSPIIGVSTQMISRVTDYTETPATPDSFTVSNLGVGTVSFSVDVDYAEPGEPPWLLVDPSSSSSTGPGDPQTITVTYLPAVSALPVGVHTAAITVSDPASQNLSETVTVLLTVKTVLPDMDEDGDVDQIDFGRLQACFTQAGQPPASGCESADFNRDSLITWADFEIFKGCLSGPSVLADKSCDDAFE